MILSNPVLQRRWCARAMNYLEVYLLSRDELLVTVEPFPATMKIIRRYVLLLALRRYLIHAVRMEKKKAALTSGSMGGGKGLLKRGMTMDHFLDAASAHGGGEEMDQSTAIIHSNLVAQQRDHRKLLQTHANPSPELAEGSGSKWGGLITGISSSGQTTNEGGGGGAVSASVRQELDAIKSLVDAKAAEVQGEVREVRERLDKLCAALLPAASG